MPEVNPALYTALREAEQELVRERLSAVMKLHMRTLGDNCSCGWLWNGGAEGHYSDHVTTHLLAALFEPQPAGGLEVQP